MISALPLPLATPASESAPLLGAFQSAFARELFAPPADADTHEAAAAMPADGATGTAQADWLVRLTEQPGFAVYRNTVHKGCIDALQANYPAVTRIVGEEWFRAAAAIYVRASPPSDARLLQYGQGFADFLTAFPPAQELDYLAPVARVERCWTESHLAVDQPVLDGSALGGLSPQALGATVLHPHPAARWLWWADAPVFTIWQRNRADGGHTQTHPDTEAELVWNGEGALLTRPEGAVQALLIGAGSAAFLNACAAGLPLAEAAAKAMDADAAADLSLVLAGLLQAGAFSAMSLPALT